MQLTLRGFGVYLLQAAGWAVLLVAGGLLFQTVVTEAIAQPTNCPYIDDPKGGRWPCNVDCTNSLSSGGTCTKSCNNNSLPQCSVCSCTLTADPNFCGCH